MLRHRPDSIGLALDAHGWAGGDELLARLAQHGTASRFLKSVLASGLRAGARHGFPAVLSVDATRMHADGIAFYRSDNGVWPTAEVKPTYLGPAGTATQGG